MQGFEVRQMTLCEEIENLDIEQEVKDRLLRKLEEMKARFDKNLECATRRSEMKTACDHEKHEKLREQNMSLRNACFALSAALNQQYEL